LDFLIMVPDLLSVSLDPFRIVLVLREIDIQLVFSRRGCRGRIR